MGNEMPRPQRSDMASPEAVQRLYTYARFADGMYCKQEEGKLFNFGRFADRVPNSWTVRAQSCNSKTNHWALMWNEDRGSWVLAFRGTQSPAEGIQDAFAYSVEQSPEFVASCINQSPPTMSAKFAEENANMHLGFALGMYEQKRQLKAAIALVPKDDPIVITGHSLGGALANCFVNMKFLNGHRGEVSVYMYGAPAVFHKRCPSVRKLNVVEMVLVVNGHDPVPRLLGPHNEAVQVKGALVLSTLAAAISAHSDYRSGGKGGGKEFAEWMTDERKLHAIQGSGNYKWPRGMTLAVITPDKKVCLPDESDHGSYLDGSLGSIFNVTQAFGPDGHSMQDGYRAGLFNYLRSR